MTKASSAPVHPPLRIALVAFDLPGDVRSPVAHAVRLAQALTDLGAEAHVFANATGAYPRLHRLAVPAPSDQPVAAARALCAAAAEHLGRATQEGGAFRALHAIQWSAVPAVLAAARRGESLRVATLLDTVFSRHEGVNSSAEIAHVRRLEQQAVDACDVVLAGSEPVRQELAWLYGRSAAHTFVSHADAVETGPAPAPGADRCVAFAGTWDASGGADLFLDTARLLAAADEDWRFAVPAGAVSKTKLEVDLRRRGAPGLADRFAVAESEEAALSSAALALIPARDARRADAVFRAWRAARPVVVTRTGPHHDVEEGRDGHRAFPFARSLADAVLAATADASRLRACGAAGRLKLENQCTWPAVATKLLAIYRHAGGL